MKSEDANLLSSLLGGLDPACVLLAQDEVIIKGNPKDDSRNYTGRLLLVRQVRHLTEAHAGSCLDVQPTDTTPLPSSIGATSIQETRPCEPTLASSGPGVSEFFLIWVPYTFLARKFPRLLPISLKHLQDAIHDIGEPTEWMYTMCEDVRSIEKVQRRQNQRGMRVVTLFFLNGRMGFPLIFHLGGVTKFLDEMKKIAPVRQSPIAVDDFIVYGDYEAALAIARAAARASNNSSNKSSISTSAVVPYSGRKVIPPPPPPHGGRFMKPEELPQRLYGRGGGGSGGTKLRMSVATTIEGVVSLFLGRSNDHHLGHRTMTTSSSASTWAPENDTLTSASLRTDDSSVDEPFEFLEGLVPVELQVPRLTEPRGRSMGRPLTAAEWDGCFIGEERRLDMQRYARARATAYRGGVERSIRLEFWCFVLHAYPDEYKLTEEQRKSIRESYARMYEQLTNQWKSIFPEQESQFTAFRRMRAAIEKDVVRTDRAHSAYADDDSVKQQMLRQVLMAYAMLNFDLGYCQGMSDVLSPIVLLAGTDVEAFMCFRSFLSERCECNFNRDVRLSMEAQLVALRTLVEFFIPRLYAHLCSQHADDMSFCFRWLLMFFKREFTLEETMLLWDVIFSCPQTPQFELFVTAALLKALEPQILKQHLTYDELLKFANGTAGNLNVQHLILLAHEFYDEVASHVRRMTGSACSRAEFQPTLSEILQVLRDSGR